MSKFPKTPTVLLNVRHDHALFNGFAQACNELGWRSINLIYHCNYIPAGDPPVGLIVGTPPPLATVARIRKMGIPIICISFMDLSEFPEDSAVIEDRYAAGVLAADAFVERGFQDMGYVGFGEKLPQDPIFLGFRKQAESVHGANVHVLLLPTVPPNEVLPRYEYQLERISEWLQGLPKPLGIFTFNHIMGVRVIGASEMAGLAVPEQVAVICRGDTVGLCETAPVPLSAIDMNRTGIGRQAILLAQELAEGGKPPRDPIYVPPKGLVERRSTDILAVPDARVAAAIRFIWDHFDWPLRVEDVAREVGTSRNTLERAFRRCLDRGVSEEIRRKRLEHCKELLRSTDMHLGEIVKSVGLSSRRYLHHAFKEAFGTTPQQYRKSLGTD